MGLVLRGERGLWGYAALETNTYDALKKAALVLDPEGPLHATRCNVMSRQ